MNVLLQSHVRTCQHVQSFANAIKGKVAETKGQTSLGI